MGHFLRGARGEEKSIARCCGAPREQAVSAGALSLSFHFLQNRKFPGFARSLSSRDKNSNNLQEESLPARQSLLANFRNTGFCKKSFLRGARREGRSIARCYGAPAKRQGAGDALAGRPENKPSAQMRSHFPFISCRTENFPDLQEAFLREIRIQTICKKNHFQRGNRFLQILEIRDFARSLSSREKISNYLQEESLPARQSLLANFRNTEFCKKSFLRGARREGRSRARCYGAPAKRQGAGHALARAPREQAVSAGALSLAFHFLQNRKFPGFARSLSSRDKNSNNLQEESLPARQSLLANFRNTGFCKKSFLRGAPRRVKEQSKMLRGVRGEEKSRGCLGGAPREQAVSAGALSLAFHYFHSGDAGADE